MTQTNLQKVREAIRELPDGVAKCQIEHTKQIAYRFPENIERFGPNADIPHVRLWNVDVADLKALEAAYGELENAARMSLKYGGGFIDHDRHDRQECLVCNLAYVLEKNGKAGLGQYTSCS